MEKENKILTDILFQLQGKLSDMLNCKSEMRSTENDALLYGKFPIDDKRYTVVIHVAPENYVPLTAAGAKILSGEDYVQKGMMPSLKMPMMAGNKGNCSSVENESIKNKFLTEVNEVYKNSKYTDLNSVKK